MVVVAGSFGAPVLPDELTAEVLVRLPFKSIQRFHAVCRSWAAVLSSGEFLSLYVTFGINKMEENWRRRASKLFV